jgi:hypothetical protein
MINAKDVNPERWSKITILFDNNQYSIIHGYYDGEENLGERWNGEENTIGFPSTRGFPQWHVVPAFLWSSILNGALIEMLCNPYPGSEIHKDEIVRLLKKIK